MKDTVVQSYPLSPLQQGMLFHGVHGEKPGTYVQQLLGTLQEPCDVDRLQGAWQRVLDRHPVLRSSFHLDDGGEPKQKVHPQVALPFEYQDWGGLPAADREQRLEQLLGSDRQRGFDYNFAPAMRLTLLRFADTDYRLLWTYSHVALDGRSHFLVLKEAFAGYDADPNGQELELDLPRPYRDHIQWLGAEDLTVAEAFWRKTLKGFTTPTQLVAANPFRGLLAPSPCPLASAERPEAAEIEGRVPADTTKALKALAQKQSVTLATFFQAAWALLLSRYSGAEEIVFGTTRACRSSALPGAESMVGVLINTLPFRTRVPGDMDFLPWLDELRARSLAQIPFEHAPLLRIQQWSDVPAGASLFDSIAVFENYQLNAALHALGGNWPKRSFRLYQKTNYPLTLTGYGGAQLTLSILYDAGRYGAETVARMLGHLKTLLEGMAANPERKLSALPMLTDAERQQIVFDWNDTRADYPRERCIHQLVEEQVARTPDALAVIFRDQQYTYRQINARANQVAHYLRSKGVGPGTLVDVLMIRSADMVAALLGVLKSGAAYVPLDPNFPPDRLEFLVKDTQPQLILTEQALLDKLPGALVDKRPAAGSGDPRQALLECPVVCSDRDWPEIARQSDANPPCTATPQDRAYIIFTSGSTGTPKGVVLQHRPVVNTLAWVNKTFKVGPGDRLLFVTSQCFDLSVYDMFGSLSAGSTIRVCPAADLKNPEKLVQYLCDDITFWDSAPPMLQQLVPLFPQVQAQAQKSKLRLVFLSGDWIPVPMPDQVRSTFPKALVVSLGGATEAAIWSNCYRIGKVEPDWPSIPYGKPFQNCRYYILDSQHNPVPIGVPGELYIGGECLAAGYHNRAELTAERFIPDPFSGNDEDRARAGAGPRIYRTGDLARYLPDGTIEFLGRVDFQVKIRGYRIELGEIEAALNQDPDVRQSVVTARADQTGVKVLVAYVIPRDGQVIDRAAVRSRLQARLPDYMVPAHIVSLDAFPLNANGKLDRKALPAPEAVAAPRQRQVVPPSNDEERDLIPVWEEVLRVKPISITDNFFELGGHSLQAAILISRIKQKLGFAVPLSSIFEAPTIEKLAYLIQQRMWLSTGSSIIPLQQHGAWPPLYLVSGIGGHVFSFQRLALALAPDQPVFGLTAIGADGTVPPPRRIEESAAQYLKEILARQPDGPYLLGGYSVGALAAFELALQLQALGKKVDFLLVIDMNAPGYPRPLPVYTRLWMHFRNFLGLNWRAKRAYLADRLKNVRARILRKVGLGMLLAPDTPVDPEKPKGIISRLGEVVGKPGGQESQEVILKRVWAALGHAIQHYRPERKFAGKILLAKAAEEDHYAATVMDDPLMGWGQYATQGVDPFTLPGHHLTVFQDPENAVRLATRLKEAIQAATAPAPKSSPPATQQEAIGAAS